MWRMDYVIGVDVHKRTHTLVIVNALGLQLGTKTIQATPGGHQSALNWVRLNYPSSRLWAVEDVRGLSGRLEADLLDAGETVARVHPRLTARQRASARTVGKSDPIDALAVARVALREPDLPTARHDDYSRQLKLLTDRRDDLVAFQTATINRLLGRLHEIDPECAPKSRSLCYENHRKLVEKQLDTHTGVLADIARQELQEVAFYAQAARDLKRRITSDVATNAPNLMALYGCGPLTAAKIIGETADISRFATEAKYARYAGVAPVDNWSGESIGMVRSRRTGNRQLNRALFTIALTQIKSGGRGEPYYRRRIAAGDSHRRALRSLKRHICRCVYRCLVADAETRARTTA
jgi:transposase